MFLQSDKLAYLHFWNRLKCQAGVREGGKFCSNVKCLLTSVKKKKSKLAHSMMKTSSFCKLLKGLIGLLSEDFGWLGSCCCCSWLWSGFEKVKWLFSCLALFLCSQTITFKVDAAQHGTHEGIDNGQKKVFFPIRWGHKVVAWWNVDA